MVRCRACLRPVRRTPPMAPPGRELSTLPWVVRTLDEDGLFTLPRADHVTRVVAVHVHDFTFGGTRVGEIYLPVVGLCDGSPGVVFTTADDVRPLWWRGLAARGGVVCSRRRRTLHHQTTVVTSRRGIGGLATARRPSTAARRAPRRGEHHPDPLPSASPTFSPLHLLRAPCHRAP